MKLFQSVNSLYELIFSGVLERFPRLKLVLVENEIGWIPFVLEQWDYYFKRHGTKREGLAIKKLPSEYFHGQIYTTFFNDAVGGHILSWWGADNCMWSNDFPHGNSTWPNSRQVVARDLGDLPPGCALNWCAKTSRDFTTFRFQVRSKSRRSPSTLVRLIKGHLEFKDSRSSFVRLVNSVSAASLSRVNCGSATCQSLRESCRVHFWAGSSGLEAEPSSSC